MKWFMVILVAVAIGAGPATEPEELSRARGLIDSLPKPTAPDAITTGEQAVDAFDEYFNLMTKGRTVEKISAHCVGSKDSSNSLSIFVHATSTEESVTTVMQCASVAAAVKLRGAPFSTCMVIFECPAGSAYVVIPMVEAEMIDRDGRMWPKGSNLFFDGVDWTHLNLLRIREKKYPGVHVTESEINRVVDEYVAAKGKGNTDVIIQIDGSSPASP